MLTSFIVFKSSYNGGVLLSFGDYYYKIVITIIAFLTMFIDHVGLVFFQDEEIWRVIGRLSFPLFAWGIVRGFRVTKNKEKYAKRIFYLATISQIPVLLLFGEELYNICFTLLFGLICLFLIEQENVRRVLKFAIILSLLAIAHYANFDYGIYGILTIILIHLYWQQKKVILYFSILTFLFYCVDLNTLTVGFSIQLYSIFSLFLLYFTPIQRYDFKLNFYFKYSFYPAHLLLLYFVKLLVS